jgi:hypothetical protein
MASYSFFSNMNIKEFKLKFHKNSMKKSYSLEYNKTKECENLILMMT